MKIADQVKKTVEEIIACPDVNGLYSLSSVNLFDFALDALAGVPRGVAAHGLAPIGGCEWVRV